MNKAKFYMEEIYIMTQQLGLKKATTDMAREISSLINLCYRSDRGWTNENALLDGNRTSQEQIKSHILRENIHFLVATEEDKLITCISLEKKKWRVFISLFAVHPDFQSNGLGKLVLQNVETYAQQNLKADQCVISVISQRKELVSYYKRRGYKPMGISKSFPKHLDVGTPKMENLSIEELDKELGKEL